MEMPADTLLHSMGDIQMVNLFIEVHGSEICFSWEK